MASYCGNNSVDNPTREIIRIEPATGNDAADVFEQAGVAAE
jgi:hypothetical protein